MRGAVEAGQGGNLLHLDDLGKVHDNLLVARVRDVQAGQKALPLLGLHPPPGSPPVMPRQREAPTHQQREVLGVLEAKGVVVQKGVLGHAQDAAVNMRQEQRLALPLQTSGNSMRLERRSHRP